LCPLPSEVVRLLSWDVIVLLCEAALLGQICSFSIVVPFSDQQQQLVTARYGLQQLVEFVS
jgi:hypothetical protein